MTNDTGKIERLVIVSNRLPFTVSLENGEPVFRDSQGGLVSGLKSFLRNWGGEFVWVGWPGFCPPADKMEQFRKDVSKEYCTQPIFVPEDIMDKFYQGFCNSTIWPLFHYFPMLVTYDQEQWEVFKQVNEIFFRGVAEVLRPDDKVWIHDYHLMLLPAMIRKRFPDQSIGFFLHIPFPSFEIFRLLPRTWGSEIIEGLLGADLVGFHTYDCTKYFLRTVLRITGYEHNLGLITLPTRTVRADTFPIGIEFAKFNKAAIEPEVERERNALLKTKAERKVIFSVDRLDYTKGILNRLEGYECFLEKYPEWHQKVIFMLTVVPSRIGVYQYQQMKSSIDGMVGKINGRFGGISWTPVVYQYHSVQFPELVALYGLSEIALITPLRDGMNLVAKEYVASRTDGTGVLILSEMAGAANELGEAIIINPNHKEDIAKALKEAAEMLPAEQKARVERMQQRLRTYDILRWSSDFLSSLDAVKDEQKKFETRWVSASIKESIRGAYQKSRSRLLLFDYDGTLVPFARYPHAARPDRGISVLLSRLASDDCNDVAIVSGRDRDILNQWFGSLPLGLVAEHGAWIKTEGNPWGLYKPLSSAWKESLRPILEIYADRLPGAFVEEKEYSLVWHYRMSDPEFASVRVTELIDHLTDFTANIDVQVISGSKVVEIRNAGISKANAAHEFLSRKAYDFVLAVGDDWTDEDLFKALPPHAYSIKVGHTLSNALYNVPDHRDVHSLLSEVSS